MYGIYQIDALLALWDALPVWSGLHWPELEAALRAALARWRQARDDEERSRALIEMEDALKQWAPQALEVLDVLSSKGTLNRGETWEEVILRQSIAAERGVVIDGDVKESVIITGDQNRVQVHLEHRLAHPPTVLRYPDIACPERVSLETRRFQVVVRLGLTPSDLSPTQEPLPLEAEKAVRLHLDAPAFDFLGPQDQETFILPNAPSPPVVFDLRPRAPGAFPLTITFFQETAPLGSVSWTVEVVEAVTAERARSVPVAPLPVEPRQRPERLLLIEYAALPTPRLRFQLVEGATWHPAWELPLQTDPGSLAETLYRDLDLLREQADPVTRRRVLNPEGVLRRLKALGQTLWRQLIPQPLKERYTADREAWYDASLLLYTAEPHIPWELVWPYGEGWEDEGPWAMTLDLARWLPASSGDGHTPAPPVVLPLTGFGCLVPEGSGLPAAEKEAEEVRQLLGAHGAADRTPPTVTWTAVMKWLEAGQYDWVHVAAHGSFYPDAPDLHATLRLGDEALTPAHLVGPLLEDHLRRVRPVFVVNACGAGRLGWTWTGMGGWAQRLVRGGVGAFLAPMWAASDDAALTFATHFYKALLDKEPVSRAVRQARCATRDAHPGDPTYLAYSLYAHPSARLCFPREVH